MTKLMSKAMVAMALLTGCGDVSLRTLGEKAAPVAELADEVETTAQGLSVDLRMRSIGAEKFSALQLFVDEVLVTADGIPIPTQITEDLVDFADMDHATKVATLQVPAGTKMVEFTVKLAPSGYFEGDVGEGWLDARSTELRFRSTVENLAWKGKAVVELNAAKSLTLREPGTLAVVPKFRVEY